ncbi:MAG: insulinase family protein [Bacillus subtilis]|nr:insulinase family protein [Bacillus subtilis]
MESRGASVGISNVGESVNFSLSSTKEDFPFVLEILSKILMKPNFSEDEFAKYKKLALAGIKQKKNNPSYLARMAFSEMIYPKDHVYYIFKLRTQEKQVQYVNIEHVKKFYDNYYNPNGSIMAVAGNVDSDEVFNLIEKYFGNWQYKEYPEINLKSAALQRKPKRTRYLR